MARARLISRTLGTSRCFAELGTHAGALGEFAQALYPMLVVHADDHGREHGDAFTVKHAVWPTSPRSVDEFEAVLTAMVRANLIHRYTIDGVTYFQIRAFTEHQQGLHKRRPSKFPEFPGTSGNTPESFSSRARAESESDTETNRTEKEKEGATRARAGAGTAGDWFAQCGHSPKCRSAFLCREQSKLDHARRMAAN